jgi:hypothetical protein
MTRRSLLLFATAILLPGLNAGANGAPPCDNLATRLASTEKAQDARISEVKSIRRYVLHNPRWTKDATATVLFTYEPDGRKRYEVLNMNAEGLQERVLHRILDGEVEAASKKSEDSSISPENYQITPLGYDTIKGRRCMLVSLTPLKKSRTLIEGRAWIDEREAAPVRIEGRTAKSLSFWVGRPYIVQDFRKVGDFWLSSENHSVADVKMIGKTELQISFIDYAVTPKNGEVQIACVGHCSPRLVD